LVEDPQVRSTSTLVVVSTAIHSSEAGVDGLYSSSCHANQSHGSPSASPEALISGVVGDVSNADARGRDSTYEGLRIEVHLIDSSGYCSSIEVSTVVSEVANFGNSRDGKFGNEGPSTTLVFVFTEFRSIPPGSIDVGSVGFYPWASTSSGIKREEHIPYSLSSVNHLLVSDHWAIFKGWVRHGGTRRKVEYFEFAAHNWIFPSEVSCILYRSSLEVARSG